MKTENLYIIWAHPRTDSLTANIVKDMQDQATEQGINVNSLDLYRINFDPVLHENDEPDWHNPAKQYSPEVHRLFAELDDKDTVAIVFPVWWFSFPAILKGYLDRVWNNGLAYGEGSSLQGKKVRYIALVGGSRAKFLKHGWEKNMTDYAVGTMNYLGIKDVKIDFLYNTIALEEDIREGHYQQLFAQSRNVINTLNS